MRAASRRAVLQAGVAGAAGMTRAARADGPPPRIAAVVTEYRENAHADVIVTKFLEGCRAVDLDYHPRVRIASLYLDQVPPNDLGHLMARRHDVPVFPSIEAALTLGTERLAVDGVLLIGEHGRYPYNELGQHLYPRKRFFDAAAAVVRRSGRGVPFFSDKHLSWSWAEAKAMVDTARELSIPFMAGSSIPVSWRRPEPELPVGADLREAVMAGYGPTEAYGFHTLEGLQCMAERRRGGESGVRSVRHLAGAAVWQAGEAGAWSWELLRAALARSEKAPVREASPAHVRERVREPEAFMLEYRDGFRAAALLLDGLADEFLFAGRVEGRPAPVSTLFWLQDGKPFAHFGRLCLAMETMFLSGRPAYPVQRTLLTTGILDRVMQSRFRSGALLETPELAVAYRPGEA